MTACYDRSSEREKLERRNRRTRFEFRQDDRRVLEDGTRSRSSRRRNQGRKGRQTRNTHSTLRSRRIRTKCWWRRTGCSRRWERTSSKSGSRKWRRRTCRRCERNHEETATTQQTSFSRQRDGISSNHPRSSKRATPPFPNSFLRNGQEDERRMEGLGFRKSLRGFPSFVNFSHLLTPSTTPSLVDYPSLYSNSVD